jgi:hypothetical protein
LLYRGNFQTFSSTGTKLYFAKAFSSCQITEGDEVAKTILVIAVLMLSLSCEIGGEPRAEEQDSPVGDDRAEVEVVIENGLDGTDIVEVWIDPASEPWSENRLDEALEPSEDIAFIFHEADNYDIQVIDENGNSYTLQYQSIDESGFHWLVRPEDSDWNPSDGEATVTIENGLRNKSVWYVYCTPSSAEAWGEERLGYLVLEPGDFFSFDVAAEDYYDLYARSGDSDFYFSFDSYVGAGGFTWLISPSDLDNSIYQDETHGPTAPVTLINRLGNASIIYAFSDESGGEYWGSDLLEGVVLSPGDEFTFNLEADRFYDFQVEDEQGTTYTLWEVSVKDNGIFWEVTRDDMDE